MTRGRRGSRVWATFENVLSVGRGLCGDNVTQNVVFGWLIGHSNNAAYLPFDYLHGRWQTTEMSRQSSPHGDKSDPGRIRRSVCPPGIYSEFTPPVITPPGTRPRDLLLPNLCPPLRPLRFVPPKQAQR